MKKNLEVISVGSTASLGGTEVTVSAVKINAGDHVTYDVVWMNGNSRVTATVDDFELTKPEGKRKIGFIS